MGKRQYTNEEYIEKAISVHKGKYDYSCTMYVKAHEKIDVLCVNHGVFTLKACSHLQGTGCPACGGVKKYDQKSILIEFTKRHGNKFDYSKVAYKGRRKKVVIVCPVHGEFLATPMSHLMSVHGCARCAPNASKNTSERIRQFITIHGDKYQYSEPFSEGTDSEARITITCQKGHVFIQTIGDHINGHGCKQCFRESNSGIYDVCRLTDSDKTKDCKLYHVKLTRHDGTGFHKIGVTINNPLDRVRNCNKIGLDFKVLNVLESNIFDCVNKETMFFDWLENKGKRYRVHDFKDCGSGWTECFYPCKETDRILSSYF